MNQINKEKIGKVFWWIFFGIAVFMFIRGFGNFSYWKWGLFSQDWIVTFLIGLILLFINYNQRISKLEKRLENGKE